jgi:hypothetical protein
LQRSERKRAGGYLAAAGPGWDTGPKRQSRLAIKSLEQKFQTKFRAQNNFKCRELAPVLSVLFCVHPRRKLLLLLKI